MANGKLNKRLARAAKKALKGARKRNPKSRGSARLKKILGMRQHPTAAGQAQFGEVDVTGAQTTAREQGRLNERLGAAAGAGLGGLVGAQMTPDEIRRMNYTNPRERFIPRPPKPGGGR